MKFQVKFQFAGRVILIIFFIDAVISLFIGHFAHISVRCAAPVHRIEPLQFPLCIAVIIILWLIDHHAERIYILYALSLSPPTARV